ncbi:MAG: protein kinase [Lentisphaeria bacterium]|nr:protein kinase [Lentisphaeria bacterium]
MNDDTTSNLNQTTQSIESGDTTIAYSEKTIVLSAKHFEKNIDRAEKIAKDFVKKNKISASTNLKNFFQISNSPIVSTIFNEKIMLEEHLKNNANNTDKRNKQAIYDISANTENSHNIHDDFEIVSKLAEGGQGYISSAVDKKLGRIIAIKSLHDNLKESDQARNNFITEAKITAQLDHPGIVSVYSLAGDDSNGLHLAMKLVNGETLSEYLFSVIKNYQKHGIKKFNEKKSISKRLNIIIKSCEAIAYAHNRNVMHCDLKPDNIMIGEYGETYIMDWGIAKLIKNINNETLGTKVTAGTPQYFAPETLRGKTIDHRSDIYTMGIILFETVYLKKAFNGNNDKEIMTNVKNHRINSFKHTFHVPVSRDLRAIIMKATAFEVEERYQSMNELIEDLRHFLNNEETSALPDNSIAKVFRWSAMHIKSLLLIILASIFGIAVLAFFNIYNHIKASSAQLQQEIALSNAYSKNLAAAATINLQMGYIEDAVKFLSSSISFLLTNDYSNKNDNTPKKLYFDSQNAAKNHLLPAQTTFDKFYRRNVNYHLLGYLNTDNLPKSKVDATLNKIQVLLPTLQKTIRNSDISSKIKLNRDRKTSQTALDSNLPPIFMLYCGFDNGLFITYPGFIQEMANFVPKKRDWYVNAMNHCEENQIAWSVPYLEAVTNQITISCSAPIVVNNQKIGAFGADLTISALTSLLKQTGNSRVYSRDKSIIDEDGNILLSTLINYENIDQAEFMKKKFASPRILGIIKLRKNGYFINEEKNVKYVYLFSYIPQLNYYYVEKVNYELLMDSVKKEAEIDELG